MEGISHLHAEEAAIGGHSFVVGEFVADSPTALCRLGIATSSVLMWTRAKRSKGQNCYWAQINETAPRDQGSGDAKQWLGAS